VISSGHVQVKIMRPHDLEGRIGPKTPLPDVVTVHEPKESVYDAVDKPYAQEDPEIAY
jgi:small subunit ribosomal protein S3e